MSLDFQDWKRLAHTSKVQYLLKSIIFLFSLYLLLLNSSSHELWRDETDAWLVSRDSTSVSDLLNNVKYTGRPPLWYLILFTFARISPNVEVMKFVTFGISTTTLLFICFLVRSELRFKILLLLGFHFLFGFTVLSRDYSLLLLIIVLIFVTYQSRHPLTRKLSLVLFLCLFLSSINIFGILITLAIASSVLVIVFRNFLKPIEHYFVVILLVVINLAWVIFMVVIARPPKDHFFSVNPPYEIRVLNLQGIKVIFWKSIGFFSQLVFPFWQNYQVSHVTIIFSMVSIFIIFVLIRSLPGDLRLFSIILTIFFWMFHVFGYSPFWWHRGSLSAIYSLLAIFLLAQKRKSFVDFKHFVVMTLLVCQILGSIFGLGKTFWGSKPYSNSFVASSFLSKICTGNKTIVAESDLTASALAAYLPQYRFFYLNREEFGSFTSWKAKDYGYKASSWSEVVNRSSSIVPCAYVLTLNSHAIPPSNYAIRIFQGSVWGDDYQIAFLVSNR